MVDTGRGPGHPRHPLGGHRRATRCACTSPMPGPASRGLGHRQPFDACTTLDDEEVLLRGADPQTTEGVLWYSTDLDLAPERPRSFHGTRFQIEFAFREARQHPGLNDGRAYLQAPTALSIQHGLRRPFPGCLQARLPAERPLGPFSLRHLKFHNFDEAIYKRLAPGRPGSEIPPNPRPVAAASRRNASGCAHPLSSRDRPAPERGPRTRPAHRLKPQNVSKP